MQKKLIFAFTGLFFIGILFIVLFPLTSTNASHGPFGGPDFVPGSLGVAGDVTSPYDTTDTTPTITFSTNVAAWCRVSLGDLAYFNMPGQCTGGEGTTLHTCQFPSSQTPLSVGSHSASVACRDAAFNVNDTSDNLDFTFNVNSAVTCSGNVSLSLSPNPATPGQLVTPTASGLSGCTTVPAKVVSFRQGSCTTGTQVSSCTISGAGTGCTGAAFSAPGSTTSYNACIDKNGNGSFADPGDIDTTTLTVSAPSCSGTLNVSLSPNSTTTGTPVFATGTGLSNCTGEAIFFHRNSPGGPFLSQCLVGASGGGCTAVSFPAFSSSDNVFGKIDKDNDGSFAGAGETDFAFLAISGGGPGGTVDINGGAVSTSNPNVNLDLTCTGCTNVQVAEGPDPSGGTCRSFASSIPFVLSSTPGVKTVSARFANSCSGPWGAVDTDTINLSNPGVNFTVGGTNATPNPTTVGVPTDFTGSVVTGAEAVNSCNLLVNGAFATPMTFGTGPPCPPSTNCTLQATWPFAVASTFDVNVECTDSAGNSDVGSIQSVLVNPPGGSCVAPNACITSPPGCTTTIPGSCATGVCCTASEDSDGDGSDNGAEVGAGSDPNDPNSQPGSACTPACTGTEICVSGSCVPAGSSGGPTLPTSVIVTFPNPIQATSFTGLINTIIDFIFTVAVIVAPILLVIAGVIFMTAAGDPGRVATARRMLLWTIIGFGIILISKGLVTVLRAILGV